jgi:hypothetical protein
MKTSFLNPPRRFDADGTGRFALADTGSIELAADEQLTFTSATGSEYDVARKAWGYYATPSLNSRLPAKGLRPVLTRSGTGRYFVCLVEVERERQFEDYLQLTGMRVLGWLDDATTLSRIEAALQGS